jgi:hypothetical protein
LKFKVEVETEVEIKVEAEIEVEEVLLGRMLIVVASSRQLQFC